MKLFMAGMLTETNTFAPIPTGRDAFLGARFHRRDGSLAPPEFGNIPLIEWRRLAEQAGIAVAEGCCANAQPAGLTVRPVYEAIRAMILDDLRAALPVDMVLLNMHGAMVAEGEDDCEGDVLAAVRDIVGPDVVIGCELDLHCHLTERMRANADLIVTYKEYPHSDIAERARDLFALALRTARREVRPVIAYRDLRMINMWHTPREPVRSLVADMKAAEGRDGILSVSFGHGFPWADVADVGAKMVVIADGDAARAAAAAEAFAERIWAMRAETGKPRETPDQALDAALAAPRGPVVIAETSDNAGGGAASDGTEFLRLLLDRGVRDAAIGIVWDPVAVSLCAEAGLDATLPLRIGGKCGPTSGDPVDVQATVRGLSEDHVQTGLSGGRSLLGPSAWVEAAGIHIILCTIRQQAFHPDGFTGLGCTLHDKRVVVVKSSQHFHAGFAPIAADIRYAATPRGLLAEFAQIPLTKIRTPWWPKVADPWQEGR
ncbi:M81 family metallopeptidase [Paracraurococcus ruber]|uniref:Microcystinase C n=1 Tax=Paracraurococcus ruber TaxID=77675 RepID=A0ABS1CUN8_9PROT|nr:M81 family metallopeptidase [Paracraurococcus ruber]MBK1658078.1 microcystin LR degradation protein MlrC-like protein [Paracraurococcus ruber]TDG34182.1 M81 family peptidase [Paracraurococcus ruber]